MTLNDRFGESWVKALGGEESLLRILLEINEELFNQRKVNNILPEQGSDLMFKAFRLTPFDKVRVVILGMDIYHTAGVFNGVAFGNGVETQDAETIRFAPSLRNILKELKRCYNNVPHPSLYSWAAQGALLINTAHSVVQGDAGSHLDLWKSFTSNVFRALNTKDDIVWMLWGADAQKYERLISNKTHKVIKAGHPSPLNRSNPFVGSNCFLKCDRLIDGNPIVWVNE